MRSNSKPQSYDDFPKPTNIIVVIGFPRSGNTWLSRLIGDVLDSPVGGYKNANPLCTEGMDRKGAYYVTQLHVTPTCDHDKNEAILGAWRFNICAWSGEKLVHVIRDPRDVAVSVKHYWNIDNMKRVIEIMKNGADHFGMIGPWDKYIESWMSIHQIPVRRIFFENLLQHPTMELEFLFRGIDIKVEKDKIVSAIDRQSFDNKRKQIEKDGDGRPYGKTIQLKHLRKGIIGDWENHFTRSDGELFDEYFGDMLRELGYEERPYWWVELKE